jgi:phage terminase large subunit
LNVTPSIIGEWAYNPCKFVVDNFKVTPDRWQEQALKLFPSQKPNERRIALQACAGPGKSAVLSWMGWNFIACYGDKGEHPKGAAVSSTADNLKDNLWPEFSKWRDRSPYLRGMFTWTKERVFQNQHPETWFISARSWSKTANAEEQGRTLSGLHSKFVLALLDESGETPPPVAKVAEQALSNCVFGKIIQAGNPTSHLGILYDASTKSKHLWTVIRITGDPDDQDRSPRIDIAWAKEQIETWGRDNPWVMSYILGLFPPSSVNSLIGPDEVALAMSRHIRDDQFTWAQKRIGIDAARFGDDSWCFYKRQGLASYPIVRMRNPRTEDVVARVANLANDWGGNVHMFGDGTGGFGAGAIDGLLQTGYKVMEVHFGGKPIDPRFFNKRSEMIWNYVDWIKRGGVIPKDDNLAKQLSISTYSFQSGKLKIIEKDEMKKLLKVSPDELDSAALTMAMPDRPETAEDYSRQRVVTSREYDIFDGVKQPEQVRRPLS